MPVLADRARQDLEVHLPVVVDGNDTHDRDGLGVADQQHRADSDHLGIAGIGEKSPAEAIIILVVRSVSRSIWFGGVIGLAPRLTR